MAEAHLGVSVETQPVLSLREFGRIIESMLPAGFRVTVRECGTSLDIHITDASRQFSHVIDEMTNRDLKQSPDHIRSVMRSYVPEVMATFESSGRTIGAQQPT